MKAIYYPIILCLTLMLGFTSCGEDNDVPPAGAPDQAEVKSLGTYVGEWSITNTKTGKVDTYPGTITFDPYIVEVKKDSTQYTEKNVNNVIVTCDGGNLRLNANECGCNISSNSADVLSFWNVKGITSPFGIIFYGNITPTGKVTFNYNKDVRSGRGNNKVKYNYQFTGQKETNQ